MARSQADGINAYADALNPFADWTFGAYLHEAGQFGIGEGKGFVNFGVGLLVEGQLSQPFSASNESQANGAATAGSIAFVGSFFTGGGEVAAVEGGAAKTLAGAESRAAVSPVSSLAEGESAVSNLLGGNRAGEGLPGSAGVPIPNRPTSLELENLSAKHNVEFAVTYKLGSGRNGGGGQYFLYSGTADRVFVPLEKDSMLIAHTHPGGTATESIADRNVLDRLKLLGSRQRSSTIIPVGGKPFRFRGR